MKYLTFDDVLIKPKFSDIGSRSEVSLETTKFHTPMRLPIFSANMATVTETEMCKVLDAHGGLGVVHRFMTLDECLAQFQSLEDQNIKHGVSIGLGEDEFYRAVSLLELGAEIFFLDVAHGAQVQVVEQYKKLKLVGCPFVAVGNFAGFESVLDFSLHLGPKYKLDAVKVGVGPGSVCTTRIKTGCGIPQISAILQIKKCLSKDVPIIADGGIKTPGDIAKALAAGADAVMIGGMLAGTSATPGDIIDIFGDKIPDKFKKEQQSGWKRYAGSAYKTNEIGYSTSEGACKTIPYKGETSRVLAEIEGGLRSAFTYVGARNLKEFQEKAELIEVSNSTIVENKAHYK